MTVYKYCLTQGTFWLHSSPFIPINELLLSCNFLSFNRFTKREKDTVNEPRCKMAWLGARPVEHYGDRLVKRVSLHELSRYPSVYLGTKFIFPPLFYIEFYEHC